MNIQEGKLLDKVRTCSKPSQLKITDIKYCKLDIPPWGTHLVRVETNQGICGYGELRDGASPTYLKMLKSRLLGENPCDVDRLFRKIKPFGGPARQSAGVCAIELALWDLAGKAYDVPVYQFLGGRFRDKVRLYGDIHIEEGRSTGILMPPEKVGSILKGYMEQGFTVLKILSMELLVAKEGNASGPLDWMEELHKAEEHARNVSRKGNQADTARANAILYNFNSVSHPFTNMHITEQGLDELENYIERVRAVIGNKVPLALDHLGHFPLPDMIRIARRLERFHLAWLEDPLPWYLTQQYRELRQHTTTSIATGEDMYLAESFEPLLAAGGLDMVHPDLLTIGGILEGKRLNDLAGRHGVSMAMHMCESPIACIAAAHLCTACENIFALEYDAFDSPWWEDLIIGGAKPFLHNGFAQVSDAPGLGITGIDEALVREHGPIKEGSVWQSTDEWDQERSLDRIWS